MSIFSENLKRYRKEKGFSQKRMAECLLISERAYQHYELGTREPNITTLVKIANMLGVSLDNLCGNY